eukprot:CAMPEP_0115175782 /NCGR_PEP_ID=MMETSP0270-20121206/4534_1 /TAXON_ID=71861 /ORGANISM="Scrippsiella trochoidea, Strain CCMP3099" /LENGTH=244 /DNA_ID=CAMNT_0002588667 /DNA_START=62 /DNA_END=796 /DNA_ORIENTATION=+
MCWGCLARSMRTKPNFMSARQPLHISNSCAIDTPSSNFNIGGAGLAGLTHRQQTGISLRVLPKTQAEEDHSRGHKHEHQADEDVADHVTSEYTAMASLTNVVTWHLHIHGWCWRRCAGCSILARACNSTIVAEQQHPTQRFVEATFDTCARLDLLSPIRDRITHENYGLHTTPKICDYPIKCAVPKETIIKATSLLQRSADNAAMHAEVAAKCAARGARIFFCVRHEYDPVDSRCIDNSPECLT